MNDIRKITVGIDYKQGMHYIVGQEVLGGSYKIHLIQHRPENNSYVIWIEDNDSVVVLWKEFNAAMPVSIEYNINF